MTQTSPRPHSPSGDPPHAPAVPAAPGAAGEPPPAYGRKRTVQFLVINLIAVGACLAIFFLFLYGDFLTGAARSILDALLAQEVAVVLIASMPLIVGFAIGIAHMQKALRRKRLDREAQARALREGNGAPGPAREP